MINQNEIEEAAKIYMTQEVFGDDNESQTGFRDALEDFKSGAEWAIARNEEELTKLQEEKAKLVECVKKCVHIRSEDEADIASECARRTLKDIGEQV